MVNYYFIALDTNNDTVYATLYRIDDIVTYLNRYIEIEFDEFESILFQYNAFYEDYGYSFEYLEDVQKVVEYLNEKYIIFINLLGG